MSYITKLKRKIEITRKEMYDTFETNPKDPYVLTLSQKLDKLLNELQKMELKRKIESPTEWYG